MINYFNKNPLVSVLIPAFNAELFLKDCLDSVINQSYKNIEIIILIYSILIIILFNN